MIAVLRRVTYGWTSRWVGTIDHVAAENVLKAVRSFWVQPVYNKHDWPPPYVRSEDYGRLVAVLRLNGITVEVEE